MPYKALSTLNTCSIPGVSLKKKFQLFCAERVWSGERDEAIFFYSNWEVKERVQKHQASCPLKAARAVMRKTSQLGKQQQVYLGEVLSEK